MTALQIMRRELVNLSLLTALGVALFSLYSVFHFWSIEDITAPGNIPRVRYDLQCWLVVFVVFTMVTISIAYYRRKAWKVMTSCDSGKNPHPTLPPEYREREWWQVARLRSQNHFASPGIAPSNSSTLAFSMVPLKAKGER